MKYEKEERNTLIGGLLVLLLVIVVSILIAIPLTRALDRAIDQSQPGMHKIYNWWTKP